MDDVTHARVGYVLIDVRRSETYHIRHLTVVRMMPINCARSLKTIRSSAEASSVSLSLSESRILAIDCLTNVILHNDIQTKCKMYPSYVSHNLLQIAYHNVELKESEVINDLTLQ